MRKIHLPLLGALVLATSASCNDSSGQQNIGNGAAGVANSGSPGTGGQAPGTSGAGGQTGITATTTGTAGGVAAPTNCTNVSPCGGSEVGTWNVSSSCLNLSGDMDVFLTSLACRTVPATGFLQTTGSIVFNADGTYSDNTTTTGSVSFPLASSCLAISGVDVECNRVGSIFTALGWTTTSCTQGDGQCDCSLSTEQQGGLGTVLPYTDPTGSYTTSGNMLTASNATYSYCAVGDTLTVTPQMAALTGTVVLQREGSAQVTGAGGMASAGGMMSSAGAGGTMSGAGAGGVASGAGAGGMTSGAGAGGMTSGGGSGGAPSAGERPCDIYQAAGNACVAAHSTVRALFAAFDGNLYQVKRADGTTEDISVLSPGGFADAAQQDSFCSGSTCTIWRVYDQTGNGNFLEAQTPDSTVGGNNGMSAANAAAESLTVGGNQVYALFTRPSQAYWNDGSQNGMPLGSEPQGIYMVTSGEHYNGGCCYNYGNAQLDRTYHGGPTMDAVYFGNNTIWGTGAGSGPWVMADMEDGMLAGGTPGAQNPNSMSLPFPFVTAMEKNDGTQTFALKGADATDPTLNTMWSGALPGSKRPMVREGGVILGAGGDCCYSNNNASEGTFYEGAIVSGYPSDATDEEIHANIVEVGYGE